MPPRTTSLADPGRGRWLTTGIVLLALALAMFALWFQWQQTRRCLAFYGSGAARQIQAAARVELWRLVPGTTLESLQPAGRVDVTKAMGLVHLRRGLVEDANFDWQGGGHVGGLEAGPQRQRSWDMAIAFYERDGGSKPDAVMAIDFDPAGGALGIVGRPGSVGLGRLEAGLKTWIDTTLAEAQPPQAR